MGPVFLSYSVPVSSLSPCLCLRKTLSVPSGVFGGRFYFHFRHGTDEGGKESWGCCERVTVRVRACVCGCGRRGRPTPRPSPSLSAPETTVLIDGLSCVCPGPLPLLSYCSSVCGPWTFATLRFLSRYVSPALPRG